MVIDGTITIGTLGALDAARRRRSTSRSRSSRTPGSTCSPRSSASSGSSRSSTSRRSSPRSPAPTTSSTPSGASRSTTCGSGTRPRRTSSLASLEEGMPDLETEPSDWILRDVSLHRRAGRARRPRRPVRRRARPRPRCSCPASPTSRRARSASTATTSASSRSTRSATPSASSCRTRTCSTTRSAPTCGTRSPTPPTPSSWPRAARRGSTTSSRPCPTGYDTIVGERGYRMSRRREAAARDRARPAQATGDRHPRRGDVPPRLGVRARDPARARRRARRAVPRS